MTQSIEQRVAALEAEVFGKVKNNGIITRAEKRAALRKEIAEAETKKEAASHKASKEAAKVKKSTKQSEGEQS